MKEQQKQIEVYEKKSQIQEQQIQELFSEIELLKTN